MLLSLRSVIVKTFVAFCVCSFFLHAEDEIRVELTTKTELSPVYISQFRKENSPFDLSYIKALREVFLFNLQYSGYATIAELDFATEKNLQNSDLNTAFKSLRLAKTSSLHVIKGIVNEKKLDIFVFSPKTGSIKKFEDLHLTGNILIDRRHIHQLTDVLLKSLFGIKGIANSRILYSIQVDNPNPESQEWKAEIWECDWDGENPRQITYEQSYCITPYFIPPDPSHGSDRYLYVNYKNGQPKIYFSSLKNRTGKPLIDLRGNQLLPSVSKQKDFLAFISDAAGRADLFVQRTNESGQLIGKPKQLFSYPRSTQASPTFHPDGKQLAFVSDKDGTPRIYIIPVKLETNKRAKPNLITKLNKENTCPAWSPDGTKLAYSAKTNGVRQIWIYDLEAQEEQQLTKGPGNKENPSWASDSLHLVFNSTDPGSSELYIVNLNQPEAVQITSGPGKKHYPTWGKK